MLKFTFLYLLREEIINRYSALREQLPVQAHYNFYHIVYEETEEMEVAGLSDLDMFEGIEGHSNSGVHSEPFELSSYEFPQSKQGTNSINDLIPLSPSEVNVENPSPLYSISRSGYSNEDKEYLQESLEGVNFKQVERVRINQSTIL